MTSHAFSFLETDPGSVELERVLVNAGASVLSDPDFISSWDYATALEISCDVNVDLGAVLESTSLDESARLAFSIVWHASGSGLRGASQSFEVVNGVNQLTLQLSGEKLGGVLTIEACLTLNTPGAAQAALAAFRKGSLLWSERRAIRLEGDGSRFPVSHVSFSASGLAMGYEAAWMIHFESSELEDSGPGNVRLYMNTDHPIIAEFMLDPTANPTLVQMVRHDTFRQLIFRGLSADDLDLDGDYPIGSLGELLTRAVRTGFPNESLEVIRAKQLNNPSEFDAIVQARGGFLK